MFGKPLTGRSACASALFFASMLPFGIAAHLASEFAGLGWHDDAEVLLSPRHAYLAALAAAMFFGIVAWVFSVPPSQRRARLAAMIESLPFRGRGIRFTALSFAFQFIFFAVTQVGEGCPLCGGDVLVGIAAAAIAALIGAIVIALGQRRFIAFVLAILSAYRTLHRVITASVLAARRRLPFAVSARAAAFSFRYRPPPQKQRR